MTFAVGLVIGLIIGWVIEWVIDIFFWRTGRNPLEEPLAEAEARIADLEAELAETRTVVAE
ncbi:MAG TPA: hypothetical protein PKD98_31720 [Anaerolineae bacterium]|nr:hypothetical protein [Anaerolineae bacterium]